MGQLFSCPMGDFEDLDFDAVLVRSISFQDGEMRNPLRSVSFNGRDSEPTIVKSFGSHRIRFERPITTRTRELETVNSFKTPSAEMENSEFGISLGSKNYDQCRNEQFLSPQNYSTPRYSEPRHQHYSAALRLQKVYKSFRTRRQLADCAVLVEQRWFVSKFVCTLLKILSMFMSIYPFKSRSGKGLEFSFPKSSLNRWKLLDFAELKRSSISFFDIEKPETAISRWSRARTRAAKKSPYEEEELLNKDKFTSLEEDSKDHIGEMDTIDTINENNPSSLRSNHEETPNQRISRLSRGLRSKITNLQIPERSNVFDIFKKETLPASCRVLIPESPSDDGYETAEESFLSEEEFMVPKSNLFDEDEEDNDERPIPKENILRRIVSHKEMKSYQLGKQLSSRWTTGAGPRIGCMRDYPQELQNKVLEQAHLSPRGRVVHASHSRTQSRIGSMASTPCSCKDTSTARSPLASNCLVLPQTATPQDS